MQLTDSQRAEWKESILAFARKYIEDNLEGSLASQRGFFLEEGLVKNPYEDSRSDRLINSILDKVLESVEPANEGDIGEIVFTAGTLGGRALITESEGFEDLQNRIAHFESNPVVFTAPMVKQAMAESPDFPEYNVWEGEEQDDFAFVRPLFSGIDQAIRKHAPELGFNIVMDNTLAMTPEAKNEFIELIKENNAKGVETRVFAVLLTPEDVKELNSDAVMGEALEKTKLFAESVFDLDAHIEELEIRDRGGKVIYHSKNGIEQEALDSEKLQSLLKECGYQPSVKIGGKGGRGVGGDSLPREDQGAGDSGGDGGGE